jgi:hypothetical protein
MVQPNDRWLLVSDRLAWRAQMKQLAILCALGAFVFATLGIGSADAQSPGVHSRPSKAKIASRHKPRAYRRPSTVGPNGLCQRDTGKPDSELDFRNICDTEEFWARIQERGNDATSD